MAMYSIVVSVLPKHGVSTPQDLLERDFDDCTTFWLFVVVRIRRAVGLQWSLNVL